MCSILVCQVYFDTFHLMISFRGKSTSVNCPGPLKAYVRASPYILHILDWTNLFLIKVFQAFQDLEVKEPLFMIDRTSDFGGECKADF